MDIIYYYYYYYYYRVININWPGIEGRHRHRQKAVDGLVFRRENL